MKKVLLLGASPFQIPSVKTAVRLQYYTITCDYLPNNPGHKFAHESYNVSTTDKEAVLQLAKRLGINGVVCYASDPAATTAAYVAEQMGLPTSPLKSVEILANKDLFRQFLLDNGFNTPRVFTDNLVYPVVVKPVDSSGSKGVTIVRKEADLKKAVFNALKHSRSVKHIIEEYIEKDGYQIAGDGFSVKGELVFRLFAQEHFDGTLVPIGESFPYIQSEEIISRVHAEIQRLLTLLNMGTQAYNFDIRIKDGQIYLMEIGPRNGGNLIAQVTKYATGIDMVDYTIKAAMGEDCSDLKMTEPSGYWSSYMIHSDSDGILESVWIDENFRKNNVVEYDMYFKPGDKIVGFTGSNGTLGTMILRFSCVDEMLDKMESMKRYVRVICKH
jgi:biotin carboxylase